VSLFHIETENQRCLWKLHYNNWNAIVAIL